MIIDHESQVQLTYAARDLRMRRGLRPLTLVVFAVMNLLLAVLLTFFMSLAGGVFDRACAWVGAAPSVNAAMVLRDISRLLMGLSVAGTFTMLGIAIFHPRITLAVSLTCTAMGVVTMALWLFRDGA